MSGTVKHIFPGGNTSKGFFSYYGYILEQDEAVRIFVIKGGPGVGKSTYMKKIASEMLDRGYDVEYMHCSSDNNSLDGIVIPAAKVAMLDGTAPHVVDPKNPGAVDEIINLGEYWNEPAVRANRENILKDNRDVGRYFARAYRYLRAAAEVYEDSAVTVGWAMDKAGLNLIAASIVEELFGEDPIALKEGRERRLFASAITPDGFKNYLTGILNTGKVFSVKGLPGTGTEKLLERLKAAALERGYRVEAYYCALFPDKLEHLVIPAKKLAFTTVNKYHDPKVDVYAEINLNSCLDEEILKLNADVLDYNETIADLHFSRAISTISKAKAIHDRMETYYVPNMDFEAVQRSCEATLARVLEYCENAKKD